MSRETITIVLLLAVAGLGLGLSAVFSGFEIGIYCLNRLRLQLRIDAGHPSARQVKGLLNRSEDLLAALLIANDIANYVITGAVVLLLVQLGVAEARADAWSVLICTPVLFVFADMLPKNYFRINADRLVYVFAAFIGFVVNLLRLTYVVPVVRGVASWPTRLFRFATASEAIASRDAVRGMLLDTAATGVLSPYQAEIADNVLGITSITLRNVMTPIARVVMMSDGYTADEFRKLATYFTFSYVPVYSHLDRSRIVGTVKIIDGLLLPPGEWSVDKIMRPALPLDVTMPVLRALNLMRERHAVMAIVVNPDGRAAGLVTIKDLVEEIVGELEAW